MTDRKLLIGPSDSEGDWDDDDEDEDVLNFRFEYETDGQGFWLTEVDRISHGTPNSHIETHVNRTSREQAIEDLREAEELTNDSEA